MVEKRKLLHQQTYEMVTKRLDNFLKTQIPYRSDVEKMGIHRKPVLEFAPNTSASESYIRLWDEVKLLR